MVTFQEFGEPHNKVVVLLPPACATWELWHEYIDRLKERYRVIAFNYSGHKKGTHYTSLADNAQQISAQLARMGREIFLLWGVSEGATAALKILALNEVSVQYALADAPYVFERLSIKDRLTALKISCAVALLPFLSKKKKAALLEEQKRDFGDYNGTLYFDAMLNLSARSLFREFYSCFTFTMPEDVSQIQTRVGIWYGEKEVEKHENVQYLLTRFSNATAKMLGGYSHAEYWLKDVDGYLRDLAELADEAELAR